MDHSIHINQENAENTHHAVKITEADGNWLASMEAKINQRPKLLNESAGKLCCCIFRLPKSLVLTNDKAYEPQIVSIGPYHHGKEQLTMIQEHKWRFLRSFLSRLQGIISFSHLVQLIASHEETIRESYSEFINLNSRQLIEMMILDGCFIIELFYKVFRSDPSDDREPILSMAWILPFIARDFLKLENQIPFFVLEILFQQTRSFLGENIPSLKILTMGFFNNVIGRPFQVLQRYEHLTGKHILDLFRLSLIPKHLHHKKLNHGNVSQIQTAEKLHLVGIQFEPIRENISDSFLDIKFDNGVLRIPTLTLDDFSSYLLQNCVAFEQCYHHHCSNHMTTYATFMGCLINTPRDAGFLREKNIIENYLGADEQVAYFFNNLGKDMLTDINHSYLTGLFEEVNQFSSSCNIAHRNRKSRDTNNYVGSKRSFSWVIIAFILLMLIVIQVLLVIRPSLHAALLKSVQS
ncbi:hypothetical protein CCACVL1_25463 [Corchorus capsularis]|uniref:Uncharacterized protein n=1 Tax=Corchorus capsularis TaxID=210143 RepID=A0A1R3GJU4_COCAP|nr:hypothetical protein CCACVL1_25463 [Corchorus capsularis]